MRRRAGALLTCTRGKVRRVGMQACQASQQVPDAARRKHIDMQVERRRTTRGRGAPCPRTSPSWLGVACPAPGRRHERARECATATALQSGLHTSCCRFTSSWCSRKQPRHMKFWSSGIHTLRRRGGVRRRGQGRGHRSRRAALGHRRTRSAQRGTAGCSGARLPRSAHAPASAQALPCRRKLRSRDARRAPVPPLVRLHVAPLERAVLSALSACRLGLRRGQTVRERMQG